jgi:hypothetical protein
MSLCRRGQANRVRRGCRETAALYAVDDFKLSVRKSLYETFPSLSDEQVRREVVESQNLVVKNIMPDPSAQTFFERHRKPDGLPLSDEARVKYVNSALILNAMLRVRHEMDVLRLKSGHKRVTGSEYWETMTDSMPSISEKYVNSLQWNPRCLQRQAEKYYTRSADGGNNYAALLKEGKIGSKNAIKITPEAERVILSIYGSTEKPFVSEVAGIYNEFLLGLVDVVDMETGEMFDRNDFYKDGKPQTVSEAAVWRVINKPKNRRLVDARRNDFHYNRQKHSPYVERKSPDYSLSKISMDDRDLVRKTIDGQRVHAYYAYDVASGAIIGASYSFRKDTELVMECFRDMWRNLRMLGLGTPAEVEVENHLMTELKDRLYGTFQYVTFCAPMNSQEKRAEHFNKSKKYYGKTSEKALGMAHGRHYARHEAYLFTREKIFDESNSNYKQELQPAAFESIVAEDRAQIEAYNRNRMEKLVTRPFPRLSPLNWHTLCRLWGYQTETSLKRARSCTVQYREWWLSSPEIIERFKPNNYRCTAYYMTDAEGEIPSVYIYQDDNFIDECHCIGKFQEAKAERTPEDEHIMHLQLGYKQKYKTMLGEGKAGLGRLKVIERARTEAAISMAERGSVPAEPVGEEPFYAMDSEYYAAQAIHSI